MRIKFVSTKAEWDVFRENLPNFTLVKLPRMTYKELDKFLANPLASIILQESNETIREQFKADLEMKNIGSAMEQVHRWQRRTARRVQVRHILNRR